MESGEIQAAWRQLVDAEYLDSKSSGEMPSIETRTSVAGGDVRLAISNGKFCAVLLPVAISESVEPDQISQLISVRPVTLGLEGKAVRFLEARCEEEQLNEVFAKVVSDVLSRIESGAGVHKAVDEALREFRRLLHKQRVSSKDKKTIVGLIGELLTLIEVLKVNTSGLRGWHGPDSDRQDFRAGPVTIEVKTSQGADGNKIHINGMRQLEAGNESTLLIRHVRIEPNPDGELSVPDLVSEAAALLPDQSLLDEKLEKLGYTADACESWQSHRYSHVGSAAYEVLSGFPRLIPSLLDVKWPIAGVSAVTYEVDLGAASKFKVDDTTWESQVQEFCACL
jgi:hypothetical protein